MYTPTYPGLLKSHNVKPGELVKKSKQLYDQAEAIVLEIKKMNKELDTAEESKKDGIISQIELAEATLSQLDEELRKRIPSNKVYAEKGAHMRAEAAKKKGNGTAPIEPAPVEPAPVEPAPVEPAPVEPAPIEPAPIEPAPVVEETPLVVSTGPKKKSNILGIVVGSLLTVTAIYLGVQYNRDAFPFNRRK